MMAGFFSANAKKNIFLCQIQHSKMVSLRVAKKVYKCYNNSIGQCDFYSLLKVRYWLH